MHDRPFPFPRPVASIAAVTDHESFAVLIERHRGELHRHCVRVLRSPADAEDALQDALLRAWRARHTVAAGAARAWLYRIATNACYDRLARRREMLVSLDAEPDVIVLSRESTDVALVAAIRRLPERQQAVLVMRDVLNWSAQETAAVLSTSVAAANSALQRARSNLRASYLPVAA
jgi:RNA polymerase sigma-70 factor (ECF subfamily)